MKVKYFIFIISIFQINSIFAQDFISSERLQTIDNLKQELLFVENDTIHVNVLVQLSNTYKFNKPDSAIFYANKALILANQINYQEGILEALSFLALTHMELGNDSKALQICLQGIKLAEKYNMIYDKAKLLYHLGSIYRNSDEYNEAIWLFRQSINIRDPQNNYSWSALSTSNIGNTYRDMNVLDSALFYNQLAHNMAIESKKGWLITLTLKDLGRTYKKMGDFQMALYYFNESFKNVNNVTQTINYYIDVSQTYQQIGKPDSCIYYALKSYEVAQNSGIYSYVIKASALLGAIYEKTDLQKSLYFNKMTITYKDSLEYLRRRTALDAIVDFDEQQRQYELAEAKAKFQNRLRMNAFMGITFTLFVIAIFSFIIIRRKQKAKQKIESAFNQLKSTQSQLIQAEKMASLGELTAGIAHEIQNPLNFVNNFSEVSSELVGELKSEKAKGKNERDEALENEILNDISQNLEKINHHGKRASDIVKGMLAHSRTSTGTKEPTDINALADEYLRLAYHGMRAKDKSFNADFKTEFDETLPKINIIPQDIGRVLLNLINNAFYACAERSRSTVSDARNQKPETVGTDYQPEVIVSTKKSGDRIEIKVADNGNGIPPHILDKIFQPFFTTKPTGSGTGLGLSLSYDIVKAHGGELSVETKEGEGSEFTISLIIT